MEHGTVESILHYEMKNKCRKSVGIFFLILYLISLALLYDVVRTNDLVTRRLRRCPLYRVHKLFVQIGDSLCLCN